MSEPTPVTILFTDVEGSTALRTSRGDAVAQQILRAHDEVLRECVAKHGGREVKALGDGFMVAFGSARRALGCAVAIQQAIEKRNWTAPAAGVRVRIGVNTGEVAEEGGDLFGQAVNAAARIAARAKAGEILVAEVTKQLAGSGPEFTFRDRGRLRLKGFPERWRLYGLVWTSEEAFDPLVAVARRTPFVGREVERAELRRLLQQADRGVGGLAMIGGEPGVGKTRLAEELAAEAAGHDMEVFVGHCYETEGAAPYIPFVEILESALARAPSPQAFRQDLGEEAAEVARLLPKLRRLCPDIPPPLELPAEQERRYLFNSVTEALSRAARRRAAVLILDDLHWADEPTLLLFEHLAGRLPEMPALVVATYRDTDVGRPLANTFADLRRRAVATWIPVERLPEDGVAEMLRAMSGQEPPDPLVRALYGEAEGNPFFLEEVYKHLVEEGRLHDAGGRFRTDLEISELDVPEGVRLVVGRRLQRLDAGALRALAAAGIVGRAFSFELLEAMEEVDADALLDAVEDAERARLIVSVPDFAGEDRFIFAHELLRQTLLAELSVPRRRRLHARAAGAMERHYATRLDEHAAAIAHHLLEARAPEDRIFRYLVLAGKWAMKAAAFEDALRHYEAASLLPTAAEPAQRAALLFELGMARRSAGHWDTAVDAWRQSLDAYEEVGDKEGIGRVCVAATYNLSWAARWLEGVEIAQRGLTALGEGISAERGRLLAMAGMPLAYDGHYLAIADMVDEALALAALLRDDVLLGHVLMCKAMAQVIYIEYREAIEAGLRAAELFRGQRGSLEPHQRAGLRTGRASLPRAPG